MADPAVLDRITVRYEVKATFSIELGVYSGVPDKQCLAGNLGIHEESIDSISILEVMVDEEEIARAEV